MSTMRSAMNQLFTCVLLLCSLLCKSLRQRTAPRKMVAPPPRAYSSAQASSPSALGTYERLGRALSFYGTAVPVFLSYILLEQNIKFKRETLGLSISKEEEEAEYETLHDWGSVVLTDKITDLKGFYVKTAQIISTRVDIFPLKYTSKMAVMQDSLDPLPVDVVKSIVQSDLLEGAPLSELFLEFDDKPLGSASIAQVHRARLLDGRVVAVKVQRPGIEAKLLGDIANLKSFAKVVTKSLTVDYYKVFCELEKTLIFELDFLFEAQATHKIAAAVAHTPSNKPKAAPVVVPLPLNGLCSKRVMVLEFIDGIALSRLAEDMAARKVETGSEEGRLLGQKLLAALSDAYGLMLFGHGIVHGDPHPGNIFITKTGEVALLDCGQVKQITTSQRLALARAIILVDEWEVASALSEREPSADNSRALDATTKKLANFVRGFGVIFKDPLDDMCAAATAIWLFGTTGIRLPGGYSSAEISRDSPIASVVEFPNYLVLLGRATVMIKGIATRLGVTWSLSDKWSSMAREAVAATDPKEVMSIWSVAVPTVASTISTSGSKRITAADLLQALRAWGRMLSAYIRQSVTACLQRTLSEDALKRLALAYLRVTNFFDMSRKRSAVTDKKM